MRVTESGMTTRTKLRQSMKAPCQTRFAPSGIRTSNKSSLRHPDALKLSHSSVGFMANTAWDLNWCQNGKLRSREMFGPSTNWRPTHGMWNWLWTPKHCELSRLPASTWAPSGIQTEMFDARSFSVLGTVQAINKQDIQAINDQNSLMKSEIKNYISRFQQSYPLSNLLDSGQMSLYIIHYSMVKLGVWCDE